MKRKRRAIYAGSFDPITNGHVWVIEKAAHLFDQLIIAIGVNPEKNYLFDAEERRTMIEKSVAEIPNIRVEVIDHIYLAKYASQHEIPFLIRGIRSTQDYEYERGMGQINLDLAPDVATIYLMPPLNLAQVSSSMVKTLVGPDDWEKSVKRYVPAPVLSALRKKWKSQEL